MKNLSLMSFGLLEPYPKYALWKGDDWILIFGSTFRHDRVVVAENGEHHRNCLEILPRPCIFQIPGPRETFPVFFSL